MLEALLGFVKTHKEQFDYFLITAAILTEPDHPFNLTPEERSRYAAITLTTYNAVGVKMQRLTQLFSDVFLALIPTFESMLAENRLRLDKMAKLKPKQHKMKKKARRLSRKLRSEVQDSQQQQQQPHEANLQQFNQLMGLVNVSDEFNLQEWRAAFNGMEGQRIEKLVQRLQLLQELQNDLRGTRSEAKNLVHQLDKMVHVLSEFIALLMKIQEAGGISQFIGITKDVIESMKKQLEDCSTKQDREDSALHIIQLMPMTILLDQLNQIHAEIQNRSVTPSCLKKKMKAIHSIYKKLHGRCTQQMDLQQLQTGECQAVFQKVGEEGGYNAVVNKLESDTRGLLNIRSNQTKIDLEDFEQIFKVGMLFMVVDQLHPESPVLYYWKQMKLCFDSIPGLYQSKREKITQYDKRYKEMKSIVTDVVDAAMVSPIV